MDVALDDQEYAPVAGLWELREAIASLYNSLYRRGMPSQYSAENVCVSGGGRAALTRAAASLGQCNLGHFLPDYTAYEELLDIFKAFTAIPILLEGERGYAFSVGRPAARDPRARPVGHPDVQPVQPHGQAGRGRGAVALGGGGARARLHAAARRVLFALRLPRRRPGGCPSRAPRATSRTSTAIRSWCFDGLTKNWRYPGWRVTWALAPKNVVEAFASAGSFLDGGGSKPLQRAAIALLAEDHVVAETKAIHAAFRAKRDYLLSQLERLGVRVDRAPDGTFYVWGCVDELPPPLNDGMGFFRAALEEKVIVVPGEFFDVNPGKRRQGRASRFKGYVRFSFGPAMSVLEKAVARLEQLVAPRPL